MQYQLASVPAIINSDEDLSVSIKDDTQGYERRTDRRTSLHDNSIIRSSGDSERSYLAEFYE